MKNSKKKKSAKKPRKVCGLWEVIEKHKPDSCAKNA